jgi:phage shock protein A
MAIMLAKTYQALKAAGAPEEDAIAAAEEFSAYENRLTGIESRLSGVESKLDHVEDRLDRIESRLVMLDTNLAALAGKTTVLTWAIGINAAATIAILGVLLRGHGPL